MIPVPFTQFELYHAASTWGANCGPGAIAAITGIKLDELRPHLADFESKGYTNPPMMWRILDNLQLVWRKTVQPRTWPDYGLARIQWHGPWTMKGVPTRVAYPHSHWVAAITTDPINISIFDVNYPNWLTVAAWASNVVPFILRECEPEADGRWSLTHTVEIVRKRNEEPNRS